MRAVMEVTVLNPNLSADQPVNGTVAAYVSPAMRGTPDIKPLVHPNSVITGMKNTP
jgi:hypothetical protein